jgi:succinate dehydrogenase / fumarate reductase iron-sulfur subunit
MKSSNHLKETINNIAMSHTTMNLNLKVWRQKNTKTAGAFEMYRVENISDEMSFLEMMDILNEQLITTGGTSCI